MDNKTYIWDNGYELPGKDERIVTFVSSCVESVAEALGLKASEMYKRMEKVGLITEYIIPSYETLHTESRSNVTTDLIETLRYWEEKKGVESINIQDHAQD